jgi:hypothetical protein
MPVSLKIQSQKIELIQWLSTVEDGSIIEKIDALRKQENKDWYTSISKSEQDSIDHGYKDAEAGKLNSHSKARRLYDKLL